MSRTRDFRGHLLHTVTFLVSFSSRLYLERLVYPEKQTGSHLSWISVVKIAEHGGLSINLKGD